MKKSSKQIHFSMRSGHTRPSWVTPGHPGSHQAILGHTRPSWVTLGHTGINQAILGLTRHPSSRHPTIFQSFFQPSIIFSTLENRSKIYSKSIQNHPSIIIHSSLHHFSIFFSLNFILYFKPLGVRCPSKPGKT